MKKLGVLFSFLTAALIVSVCFSSFSPINLANTPNVVNGYKLFEEWGSLVSPVDYDEQAVDNSVADWIETYSSCLNYPYGSDPYYWSTYNNWWSSGYGTYRNSIQNFLQLGRASNNIEFVAQFWTGDFSPITLEYDTNPWHYGLHTMDGNVSDSEVFQWSGGGFSMNCFCMIWTCVNGGLEWDNNGLHQNVAAIIGNYTPYGWYDPQPTHFPTNPNTQYGAYSVTGYCGVPLGFTGASKDSLESWGRCYIGFLDHSPWLKDKWVGNTELGYFVTSFYQHLCGYNDYVHHTIIESLNRASATYFGAGTDWTDTPLYTGWWERVSLYGYGTDGWYFHQMKLYGDDELNLPSGGA